jgi:hypothetical protein
MVYIEVAMTKERKRSRQLDYTVYSDVEPHVSNSWCVEMYGERWCAIDNRIGTWTCFYAGTGPAREFGKYVYRFAEENDAMFFTLRWS